MSTNVPLLTADKTAYTPHYDNADPFEQKINEERKFERSPGSGAANSKYNINMSNNLRSEKEIMDFLDRYMFTLTTTDVLCIYFLSPLSIFLNICFILYNMYKLFIANDNSFIVNGHSQDTDAYLLICAKIVTGFEFGGLCILLLTLFYIYIFMKKTENYAAFIDLLGLLGSWSAFKLFYQCRPSAIFEHVSTVIKNNTHNDKKYCQTLQKEIERLEQPVCDFHIKEQLSRELQKQLESNEDQHAKKQRRGLKQFMTESAYGLVILLLFLGLFIGILSLLMKLSQLNFTTTKPVKDWTLLNWFYCMGFSNQLWNMVNMDQLKTFTIYEFLYTNNRNISALTSKKLKKMLYLDSLVKTILCTQYRWKGVLISAYMQSSYILQILLKNPFQSENPSTFEEYQQYENINKLIGIGTGSDEQDSAMSVNNKHKKIHHNRSGTILEDVLYKASKVMSEENKKWKHLLNSYLSDLKLESLTIKDPISEARLFVHESKSGDIVDDIQYNHIKIKINTMFSNLSYLFESIQDWLEISFIVIIVTTMISCIVTSMLSLFYYHDLSAMDSLCEERLIWFALCITIILIVSLLFIFICHECKPDSKTTQKLLQLNVALVALSIIATFCIDIFSDQPCVTNIAHDRYPHYHIIHIAVLTNFSLLLVLFLPIFIHLLFHPFYIIIALLSIIGAATLISDAVFTFCLIWFVVQNHNTFKDRYENYDFSDICDINFTVILIIGCYYTFNILLFFLRMPCTNSNKWYASKCIKYMTLTVYVILMALFIYDNMYLTESTCDFWQNNVKMYNITMYSAALSCIFWFVTFLICFPANTMKDFERIKQISDFLMYHAAAVFCLIFIHLVADIMVFALSIYMLYKHDIIHADDTYHGINVAYNCIVLMVVFFSLEIIFTAIRWLVDGYGSMKFCLFMGYAAMFCLELLYFLMITVTCLGVFGVIEWTHQFNNIEYNVLIMLISVLLFAQFIGIMVQSIRRNNNMQNCFQIVNHVSGTAHVCKVIFFT